MDVLLGAMLLSSYLGVMYTYLYCINLVEETSLSKENHNKKTFMIPLSGQEVACQQSR